MTETDGNKIPKDGEREMLQIMVRALNKCKNICIYIWSRLVLSVFLRDYEMMY